MENLIEFNFQNKMNFIQSIFFIIGILCSSSSFADWTFLGEFSGNLGYADTSTIKRNGDIVQMWTMTDLTHIKNDYLSIKIQYELDCNKNKTRMLSFIQHSENMGEGRVIYSSGALKVSAKDWNSVIPKSSGEYNLKIACDKIYTY